MLLQEEYLMRNSITDVPIVNYITNGSILLKIDNGYLLMTITWKEHDRGPGSYHISYHTPIHDGYLKNCYFNKIEKFDREIEWDEYYSYILSWSKNNVIPVCGDKEVILAAWEIFVFCCDGMFVDYSNHAFEKLIYRSLNDEITLDERFQGYQECMVYMSSEIPALLRSFKHDVLPHIQNYCHWLANLIKSHNEVHP